MASAETTANPLSQRAAAARASTELGEVHALKTEVTALTAEIAELRERLEALVPHANGGIIGHEHILAALARLDTAPTNCACMVLGLPSGSVVGGSLNACSRVQGIRPRCTFSHPKPRMMHLCAERLL